MTVFRTMAAKRHPSRPIFDLRQENDDVWIECKYNKMEAPTVDDVVQIPLIETEKQIKQKKGKKRRRLMVWNGVVFSRTTIIPPSKGPTKYAERVRWNQQHYQHFSLQPSPTHHHRISTSSVLPPPSSAAHFSPPPPPIPSTLNSVPPKFLRQCLLPSSPSKLGFRLRFHHPHLLSEK